jgi:DNA-binding Lrp family transcriptional regulator
MKNPKITDRELAVALGVKSPNGARRYRKKLEEKGVIKPKMVLSPEKIGFPIEFLVTVTAESKKTALEALKTHLLRVSKYLESIGEMVILTMGNGKVLIKEVLTLEEPPTGLIIARATDLRAAHTYVDIYMPDVYSGIETDFKLIHSSTIRDYLIDTKELENFFSFLPPPDDYGEALKKCKDFMPQKKWHRM